MGRKLIDYIPHILRNVLEYRAITEAEQVEIDRLWLNLEAALNDQFVSIAAISGIRRYEKILKIIPEADETLEERRFAILARFNETLPFTITKLRQQLTALCGDDYKLTISGYSLELKLALNDKFQLMAIGEMLNREVPANMQISLDLKYNTYEILGSYTHEYLSAYTQLGLRDEELS
ncbi:hypothetical protein FACS1894198_3860 [Clostridia bacterium]|nr:hypothetical protein FACS1894198_3860 [Clostridia bacterium]